MMPFFSLSLVIFCGLCSSQSNQDKYCPSSDWALCATSDNNCIIEAGIKSTTISHGVNQNGESSFIFWDVSNSQSTQEFKTNCEYHNLGDPWSEQLKVGY